MPKSLSKTPAPKSDRIYGSKVNPKGSASSEKSAKGIKLSSDIILGLTKKLKEFKETHKTKKVTLSDLKAVYRRGLGAYSSTHRPTISGGKPNTRNAWAMARVNAFLRKAGGGEAKKSYVQDDDLLKFKDGGEVDKLIEDGIVDLKMYDTTNEHSKIYGFDAQKPLYIQSIIVSEEHRGKGIGSKVMEYILDYANKNGHDVIFGHITQKAEPSVDVIKSMIQKSGFNTIEGNNDFYKVINDRDFKFKEGGEVDETKKLLKNIALGNTKGRDVITETQTYFLNLGSTIRNIQKNVFLSDDDLKRFGLTEWNPKKEFNKSFEGLKNVLNSIPITERAKVLISNIEEQIDFDDYKNTSNDLYLLSQEIKKWYSGDSEFGSGLGVNEIAEQYHKAKIEGSNDELINSVESLLSKTYAEGGEVDEHKETYKKWKSLVNMSYSELKRFYDSEEGKVAGLKPSEAKAQGIDSGRESARWIMKMKKTPVSEWTPTMWKWAKKQISFISRMSGAKGDLYDDKGNKTRKYLSLLIWGNDPKKKNNGGMIKYNVKVTEGLSDESQKQMLQSSLEKLKYYKDKGYTKERLIESKKFTKSWLDKYYEDGGVTDVRMEDTVQRMDDPNFADISYYNNGGMMPENILEILKERKELLNKSNQASKKLNEIANQDERPMGLVSDRIKNSKEFIDAKKEFDIAFKKERDFNSSEKGKTLQKYMQKLDRMERMKLLKDNYSKGGEIVFFEDTKFPKKYTIGELVYYKTKNRNIEAMVVGKTKEKIKIKILHDYTENKFSRDSKYGRRRTKPSEFYDTKTIKEGTILSVSPTNVEDLKYWNKGSVVHNAVSKEFKDIEFGIGIYKKREHEMGKEGIMAKGGETKNGVTYKDVVELLKRYQFRERQTLSKDKRYKSWRNSTKVNGEEVDCFIDTENKLIVLDSQHGLREIGYDLKYMESYFKKNRLKMNKYNDGGETDYEYFIAICNYTGYLPNMRDYSTEIHYKLSDAFDTLFDYMNSEEGLSYMPREGCFFSIERTYLKGNEVVGKVMYKITGKEALKLHNKRMLENGGVVNKKFNYRIITEDGRIKYAGTDMPSWLNLEDARKLVNYSNGEMIYEYDNKGEKLWEIFDNGGTINQSINTNIMDEVKFNQLPHIDTISNNDNILIKESVFVGNLDKPKYIGDRYIHCQVMGDGGMINSLNLKVFNSVGANALRVGEVITRPITNILNKGRKLVVKPIADALPTFKEGGLSDLYVGDEISYNGNKYEVGGITDCRNYVKAKNISNGNVEEIDIDDILDNSKLIKRK